MLSGMRKAANNKFGRILMTLVMGVLIFSFGIFGIGNWLNNGAQGALARVGTTDISVDSFRIAFGNELQRLSNQVRRTVTNDQARAAGIDTQVLARLISEAALDEEAKKLGLNVSEDLVAKVIAEDANFRGRDGRFDRAMLVSFARQNGLSEAGFLALQRQTTLRQELLQGIAGGVSAPQVLLDAMNRQRSEERSADYVVIPSSSVGTIQPPDEAALASFYNDRKADFRAPEYRKVNLLAVAPEDLAGDLSVTEDDLKLAYDDAVASGRLGTPERRTLQQIVFSNEDEAKAVSDKLQAGTPFEQMLEERKLPPEDVTLESRAKSDLIDPVIADAAFALAKGATSTPIAGAFGFTIVHAKDIQPGTVQSFDAAKPQLEAAARVRKIKASADIQAKVDNLRDQIEDLRGNGKSLNEVAAALKLELKTIDNVSSTGTDKAGKVIAIPDGDEALKAIFASTIGADTEPLRTRAGGYLWYEVAAIEPGHERNIDDVRPALVAAWISNETTRKITELAFEQLKKLSDGGATLEQVATSIGSTVVSASALTRSGGSQQGAKLGTGVLTQIFVTPVNGYGQARAETGGDRVLFKVTDARVPPPAAEGAQDKVLKQRLDSAFDEDLLTQYVKRIQTELGTVINERLLALAVGN
jgi:peptidyl-prolyl cis-trans isomerase D